MYCLSFYDIASRWAKQSEARPEIMLELLVQAFWRGDFESHGRSSVFRLMPPETPPGPPGASDWPGHIWTDAETGIVKVTGEDGEHYVTDERHEVPIERAAFASVLAGSEYMPFRCVRTPEGLAAIVSVPLTGWPSESLKVHFKEWRLHGVSFSTWYDAASLWPKPDLSIWWPDAWMTGLDNIDQPMQSLAEHRAKLRPKDAAAPHPDSSPAEPTTAEPPAETLGAEEASRQAKPRGAFKMDWDSVYLARLQQFKDAKKKPPSAIEDEAWRKEMGIPQPTVRKLRRDHRPALWKGSKPKQQNETNL
ncbi:MAG: hypothetical protein WCO00_13940 [Rhodospirillaceae bacterium]